MPPPFGQLRVAAAHVLEVALWVNRVGQGRDHIRNDKPPFVIVNCAANLLALEQRNARFGIRGHVAHGFPLYSVKLAAREAKVLVPCP